mmetsp:Transcript_4225/g.14860  ORF Transcript_4225/g.14860 Transcript_4225/m.14860 type:complete len:332 (-) Transcript_4225:1842-2837(-)
MSLRMVRRQQHRRDDDEQTGDAVKGRVQNAFDGKLAKVRLRREETIRRPGRQQLLLLQLALPLVARRPFNRHKGRVADEVEPVRVSSAEAVKHVVVSEFVLLRQHRSRHRRRRRQAVAGVVRRAERQRAERRRAVGPQRARVRRRRRAVDPSRRRHSLLRRRTLRRRRLQRELRPSRPRDEALELSSGRTFRLANKALVQKPLPKQHRAVRVRRESRLKQPVHGHGAAEAIKVLAPAAVARRQPQLRLHLLDDFLRRGLVRVCDVVEALHVHVREFAPERVDVGGGVRDVAAAEVIARERAECDHAAHCGGEARKPGGAAAEFRRARGAEP